MRNLKFALRTLFKTPFVTAVAIGSLALGIGANTAIFSLFHQLLLRELPVQDPGQLVNLAAPGPKPGSQSCGQPGDCDTVFSYPMFRDLERVQAVFTGIAAHRPFGANLSYKGQTTNGGELLVSGSYFPVLGVKPALGRLLAPGDDRAPGESPVVVLSYGFWQSHFAADPGVLNQPMIVNGTTMTIVGVTERGFDGTTIGATPEVFVPVTMRDPVNPWSQGFDNRRNYHLYLFARLKPGVTIDQARASLNTQYHAIVNEVEAPLQKNMSEQTMARFRAKAIKVEPGARGQSNMSREARAPLTLLLGVTALVLVIACANIANLLLARSAARAGEMAVRLSIGASRRQLILQLLGESCLLAVFGGVAGLFVARWTLDVIIALLPRQQSDIIAGTLSPSMLVFAGGLTLATGLLFGLFPALHSTRPDLMSSLKGQSGQPSGARAAARFRASLATAQIALSMALLVGAGLFTKSLAHVSRVDLGIKVDHVITFGIAPDLSGYEGDRAMHLVVQLEDALQHSVPGVTGVTTSLVPLLAGDNWGNDVSVQGYAAGPDTDMNSRYNEVGPGYFRTLGIPLLSGREFTDTDAGKDTPKVAIVNEAFAAKFNLGRDAVGKRIGNRNGPLDTEIVGIVQNAKYSEVKDKIPPLFYRPYRQSERVRGMSYYVRVAGDLEPFVTQIPKVVATLDANLPVGNLRTMAEQVRENVFVDRFITVLSTAFATLATLLAAIGLYGVLAYTVSQRTREIGLRMALGAAPARVRGMVLRQVGVMTLVGGAIGLTAAVWLGSLAQSLLFQMQGYDPVVLVGAAATLTLVALGAGLVPAHRASRVEPMTALRYE